MAEQRSKFCIGEVIHHKLFDYRGVIIDVDAVFQGSEEWYDAMALSRPPKDEPWYHVLVHDGVHMTYVAEQNLEPDLSGEPISHPQISDFFTGFEDGLYVLKKSTN